MYTDVLKSSFFNTFSNYTQNYKTYFCRCYKHYLNYIVLLNFLKLLIAII